jgi:hypothetical protein
VGVSVSESPDLAQLGLAEKHLELTLGEVARVVLRHGHTIVYGGHLRPGGYTGFLMSEVERYGRLDSPLKLVVAWSEHRGMSLSDLTEHRESLGLFADVVHLDEHGAEVSPERERSEAPEPVVDAATALTALRSYLSTHTDARVLIGGKLSGFQGTMPGVIEEAKIALEAQQPLYLAGGFGGAAGVVAATLLDIDGLPGLHHPNVDLAPIRDAIASIGGRLPPNGLSPEENLRLATTYRPSEVATFVAAGLHRLTG